MCDKPIHSARYLPEQARLAAMDKKCQSQKTKRTEFGYDDDVILSCPEPSETLRQHRSDVIAPQSMSKQFSKSHSHLDTLLKINGDAVTSQYQDTMTTQRHNEQVLGVHRPVALEEELQSHVTQLYDLLDVFKKRCQVCTWGG